MDIIGLGWKAIQNLPKIERVIQLSQPTLDKATADPNLVPSVQKAVADFEAAWAKIKPIIDEFNKVSGELVPLVRELKEVFLPAQSVVRASQEGYDVKWIQETLLKDLGPKALPKYGADGYYGDETRDAVKRFQQKHVAAGRADGWVGPRTAAVMEQLNPPWV